MGALTELDRQRDSVRNLLDDTIRKLEKTHGDCFKDRQIFIAVFGDTPEMQEKFSAFICKDVANCPQEVIRWCQKQLDLKGDSPC